MMYNQLKYMYIKADCIVFENFVKHVKSMDLTGKTTYFHILHVYIALGIGQIVLKLGDNCNACRYFG